MPKVGSESCADTAGQPEHRPAPSAPPLDPRAGDDGCRILIVDDEPTVARGLRRLLRAEGYIVDCADAAAEALALVERWEYDLVITDIGLPGRSGVELLQELKLNEPDLPVVLMTGAPEIQSAIHAFDYGAFHYLLKPLEPTTVLKVTHKAVHMRRFAMLGQQAAVLLGGGTASFEMHRLEASFRRAVDGLWVAYQPIVHANPLGQLYGYEALMRSDEPLLSTPPAVIAAAERLGRLKHVGRRVRERGAAPFAGQSGGPNLFVNLHPADLTDPALTDAESPLCRMASRVILEVTERAALTSIRNLRHATARLREAGYRIALDDLGSGFAGLNSFALLEPDLVKIDMALIRDLHLSRTKQKLVRSLVTLGHDMGIQVVAEGVEIEAERDLLVELECDFLQGYLFGRPGSLTPPVGPGG
jgi:EAL domain-containing protein (putative c-di-GMP-specific phosphodiesterase class I)/ActR/RegA family two-component response regulator